MSACHTQNTNNSSTPFCARNSMVYSNIGTFTKGKRTFGVYHVIGRNVFVKLSASKIACNFCSVFSCCCSSPPFFLAAGGLPPPCFSLPLLCIITILFGGIDANFLRYRARKCGGKVKKKKNPTTTTASIRVYQFFFFLVISSSHFSIVLR